MIKKLTNKLTKKIPYCVFITALLSGQAMALDMASDCSNTNIKFKELKEKRAGQTFEASMMVKSNITTLTHIITDAEKHPEFIADLEKVTLTETDEFNNIQEHTLALPMSKQKQYRLAINKEITKESAKISWKMIDWKAVKKSDRIGDTQGYWQLSVINENCTQANYHVYTDPGKVPFGFGWIVDAMTEDSIPALLDAMRDQAEAIR